MIVYKQAATDEELVEILRLQRQNLPSVLSPDEAKKEGFVTVVHSLHDLQKMNAIERHVIAADDGRVVAYLLAMTPRSKSDIPVLEPMFDLFSEIPFAGKTVADFPYIVVGQVCVAKGYRGRGLLQQCYAYYKSVFCGRYRFAITEIDATNVRSLHAHGRVGFREVHRYTSSDGVEWVIVLWDWSETDGH